MISSNARGCLSSLFSAWMWIPLIILAGCKPGIGVQSLTPTPQITAQPVTFVPTREMTSPFPSTNQIAASCPPTVLKGQASSPPFLSRPFNNWRGIVPGKSSSNSVEDKVGEPTTKRRTRFGLGPIKELPFATTWRYGMPATPISPISGNRGEGYVDIHFMGDIVIAIDIFLFDNFNVDGYDTFFTLPEMISEVGLPDIAVYSPSNPPRFEIEYEILESIGLDWQQATHSWEYIYHSIGVMVGIRSWTNEYQQLDGALFHEWVPQGCLPPVDASILRIRFMERMNEQEFRNSNQFSEEYMIEIPIPVNDE